jgi:isoleucyl-tRNA synthetase
MSKSLGNVVDPLVVIEGGNNKKQDPAYGADVLRLWISSVDYSGDVCVGSNILKQVADSYRKIRNTARYLVGNLHDFVPSQHEVPYEQLPRLDKYILGRLSLLLAEMQDAYDTFQFNRASQALQVSGLGRPFLGRGRWD